MIDINNKNDNPLIALSNEPEPKPSATEVEAKPERALGTEEKAVAEHHDITKIDADKLVADFSKHEARKKINNKALKIFFLVGGVLLVAIITGILLIVFKFDSAIFPVTVTGRILDYAGRPLENVNVCVQSKCAVTDANGNYKVTGLTYGNYYVTAEIENFRKLNEEVDLQRGTNQIDRSLEALGMGEINGKLKTASELITTNLTITIDGQLITVNPDQSFNLKNKTVGKYKIEIKSPSYTDIISEITVQEGNNNLPEITLQPACDISLQVNDWLSATALKSYQVKLADKEYTSNSDGVLSITDLPFTTQTEITINSDGYNQKLFSVTDLKQQLNQVGPYNLVKNGKITYVSERLGYQNIYLANFDGSDEKILTDNKGDSILPVFYDNNKKIGFFSTRDNLKVAGYVTYLPYYYDIANNKMVKITKDPTVNTGVNSSSFQASLTTYTESIYQGGINTEKLFVKNLDGTNPRQITAKESGYVSSIKISPASEFLIFSWYGYSAEKSGVFYVDIKSKEIRNIYNSGSNYAYVYDISSDRKSALIRVEDGSNGTSDLYSINIYNGKPTRLTNSSIAETEARFSLDASHAFYLSKRDNKTNIYRVNINGESETALTSDGKVESFYQIDKNTIAYTSQQSLWILDISETGKTAKKVTESVKNESFDLYLSNGENTY